MFQNSDEEELLNLPHTPGHVDCPACERSRRTTMQEDVKSLLFPVAAELWLETRENKNKPRTLADYRQYIRALTPFFGGLHLADIHIGHFEEYQRDRAQRSEVEKNGRVLKLGAGAVKINQELRLLARILKRAGLWQKIADYYEPLPAPYQSKPRALAEEEEARLFSIAADKPGFQLVYWTALLASWTSLSGYEIRGLRLGDVDLNQRTVYVRPESAKRRGRVREIPLVEAAHWAAERLVERAHRIGASQPTHFIFPFRISTARGGIYDLNRAASPSWIKKDWYALRDAAGVPWLRFHDL